MHQQGMHWFHGMSLLLRVIVVASRVMIDLHGIGD